jgi:hypothetical protein
MRVEAFWTEWSALDMQTFRRDSICDPLHSIDRAARGRLLGRCFS